MKTPRVRNSLLAAALAATGATAWAAYELNGTLVPGPAPVERTTRVETARPIAPIEEAAPLSDEAVLDTDGPEVIAKETEVVVARERVAVPVYERSEPAIEVTKPRLTVDQRIQADVMDLLAHNPSLSGKIGVVSAGRVVTLTGYTLTSGQAWRAGRDAGRVEGVRHVVNEIRPRIGGMTS